MKINFSPNITNYANAVNKYSSSPFAIKRDTFSFFFNKDSYEKNVERYLEKQKTNPKMAFLYKPDLTKAEKEQIAEQDPTIGDADNLAKKLGLKTFYPILKWAKDDKLEYCSVPNAHFFWPYFDMESQKNIDFIDKISEQLKNCKDIYELSYEYNIPDKKIRHYLQNGDLIPLETTYTRGQILDSYLFDITNEQNIAILNEHKKSTPVPSKKYYKKLVSNEDVYVPVTYLEKLGFSSAKKLAQMLKNGELPGIYEKVQTPAGTKIRALVNIRPFVDSEEKLLDLRNKNEDILTTSDFAKKMQIKKMDVDEAILNGELEIIKEYIFSDDHDKVFLNLKDEKTKNFIDKILFQKKFLVELKAQRIQEAKEKRKLSNPYNSLRMEIVWHFSPKTRDIASAEAEKDRLASSLLVKEAQGEELTSKEEYALNSYRKRFWNIIGSEEFSNAQQKANEYIKIYKTQGIEAIDDPYVRSIIENFEQNHN